MGAFDPDSVGGAEYVVVGTLLVDASGLKSAPTGPLDEVLVAAFCHNKQNNIKIPSSTSCN